MPHLIASYNTRVGSKTRSCCIYALMTLLLLLLNYQTTLKTSLQGYLWSIYKSVVWITTHVALSEEEAQRFLQEGGDQLTKQDERLGTHVFIPLYSQPHAVTVADVPEAPVMIYPPQPQTASTAKNHFGNPDALVRGMLVLLLGLCGRESQGGGVRLCH
jgi:hypothetical protein